MDTIVKYRFDREMVAFVKTLDIKTAMFGYDKNDVYNKFKDLLVKARDVCEELVEEAAGGALSTPREDPVEADSLEAMEGPGDHDQVQVLEVPAAGPEEEEPDELTRLRRENERLRERLAAFEEREELLGQAHAIVSEARLEREAIIRSAQSVAEQELFLYRARQKEEEARALEELSRLESRQHEMEELCKGYQAYLDEGRGLVEQLRAYVDRGRELEADASLPEPDAFDPPVLARDESLACSEESMPLCEIIDDQPEALFRGQNPDDDPASYHNEPQASGERIGCDSET